MAAYAMQEQAEQERWDVFYSELATEKEEMDLAEWFDGQVKIGFLIELFITHTKADRDAVIRAFEHPTSEDAVGAFTQFMAAAIAKEQVAINEKLRSEDCK